MRLDSLGDHIVVEAAPGWVGKGSMPPGVEAMDLGHTRSVFAYNSMLSLGMSNWACAAALGDLGLHLA